MPWEVELCQYHTHAITAQCERHGPPAEVTTPATAKVYARSTEDSQRIMADWFLRRSKGELVLDEVEGRHSPPKTPRRSPRTAALASVDKKGSTPMRR